MGGISPKGLLRGRGGGGVESTPPPKGSLLYTWKKKYILEESSSFQDIDYFLDLLGWVNGTMWKVEEL